MLRGDGARAGDRSRSRPARLRHPSEVLARAVGRRALHGDNAALLVNLFVEARFSPHVMTEAHREEAVRILQLVREELAGSSRSRA